MHDVVDSRTALASAALGTLWELSLLLAEDMDRGLTERGLTRARAHLLTALAHADGQATQRQLAEALRVTPRNITGLVDALEADRYVERRPHPSDRRATLVTLTERGQQETARMLAEARTMARQLFTDLDTRQLQQLSGLLEQVRNRGRARTQAPAAAGERR